MSSVDAMEGEDRVPEIDVDVAAAVDLNVADADAIISSEVEAATMTQAETIPTEPLHATEVVEEMKKGKSDPLHDDASTHDEAPEQDEKSAPAAPEAAPAAPVPPPPAEDSHKRVMFSHPAAPAPPATTTSAATTYTQRMAKPSSPARINMAPLPTQESGSVPPPPASTMAGSVDVTELYTAAEKERIAAAAAALTPNTVLGLFRRGGDNSHTNRMEAGSYSRYLLATDDMPPIVLNETFHGEQPTLGTVPRNTIKRQTANAEENDGQDPPAEPYAMDTASSTHPAAHRSSYSSYIATSAQGNMNWNGTAGSGTLRREVEMLDAATLASLDTSRHQRRRDPHKGKPVTPQLDHVYYNHKSKGFYVPHDPSPDTTMLQYNHMYGFGDGTRFAPLTSSSSPPAAAADRQQGSATATQRRNPHAAPPRTFAESRGCVFPLTASQRQRTSNSARGYANARTSTRNMDGTFSSAGLNKKYASTMSREEMQQQQQRRRQRADIQNGTSSLRTAKAIDLGRLHRTQCPRPRTIEEVLADEQQSYLFRNGSGNGPHPLVQDIQRDVRSGKLDWEEVPPSFQTALTAAATAAAAHRHAQEGSFGASYGSGASPAARDVERTGSLSKPVNGLVEVMGHLRPVPAIAAATATRSTGSASPHTESGAAAAAGGRRGDSQLHAPAPASSPLPVISRLNQPR